MGDGWWFMGVGREGGAETGMVERVHRHSGTQDVLLCQRERSQEMGAPLYPFYLIFIYLMCSKSRLACLASTTKRSHMRWTTPRRKTHSLSATASRSTCPCHIHSYLNKYLFIISIDFETNVPISTPITVDPTYRGMTATCLKQEFIASAG